MVNVLLESPRVVSRGGGLLPILLRNLEMSNELVAWFGRHAELDDYTASNYLRMFQLRVVPPKPVLAVLVRHITAAKPAHFSVAAISRLSCWDRTGLTEMFEAGVFADVHDPFFRRSICLALFAKERRQSSLQRYALQDELTYSTWMFLNEMGPQRIVA